MDIALVSVTLILIDNVSVKSYELQDGVRGIGRFGPSFESVYDQGIWISRVVHICVCYIMDT